MRSSASTQRARFRSCWPVFVRWPLGRQHSALVYEPGQPRDIDNGEGPPLRNLWRGFKWESHPGPIDNWRYMMDWWFDGKPDEERIWWERWAAYPIRFPGTKLFSSTLFYGPMTGSGSSLAGRFSRGHGLTTPLRSVETRSRARSTVGLHASSSLKPMRSLIEETCGWTPTNSSVDYPRNNADHISKTSTSPTPKWRHRGNFLFTRTIAVTAFSSKILDRRFFIEEYLRKMDPSARGRDC